MKLKQPIVRLAMLAMVLAAPALAQAPGATPFSADMKLTARQQRGPMTGKLYAGTDKWRMEMNMEGQQAIMIFNAASQLGYMLMPAQKMYMEVRTDRPAGPEPRLPKAKPMDPSNPCAGDADMTCAKSGTETINGRTTDRWDFKSKSNPGEGYIAWVDQKLHFPIKTETSNGDGMELANIQEGAQPADLFEVPSGYRKFSMGGMPGR